MYPQNSNTWKIQLTIAINFISSKDAKEEHTMHSMGNSIKFTSYNVANEVLDELFESFCSRYQINLETSMRGSDFIFDLVQILYDKCHKKILNVVVQVLILQTGHKRKKQQ